MKSACQHQLKAYLCRCLRGADRNCLLAVTVALMVASTAGVVAADPIYLDLSPVANRGWEDDGIAGNGEGGWSDEGANDMFIFPPMPHGDVTRNGYHFRLVTPTPQRPNTIIMLRGQAMPDLPTQVKVAVPDAVGKYIYFL